MESTSKLKASPPIEMNGIAIIRSSLPKKITKTVVRYLFAISTDVDQVEGENVVLGADQ